MSGCSNRNLIESLLSICWQHNIEVTYRNAMFFILCILFWGSEVTCSWKGAKGQQYWVAPMSLGTTCNFRTAYLLSIIDLVALWILVTGLMTHPEYGSNCNRNVHKYNMQLLDLFPFAIIQMWYRWLTNFHVELNECHYMEIYSLSL